LRVRYRIDGRMYKSLEVPQHLLGAVTSRIEIMAALDIGERRLPQDGRIHVLLDGRKIDLRRDGQRVVRTALAKGVSRRHRRQAVPFVPDSFSSP